MKQDTLKLYTKLRTSLEEERARLQARLKEIEAALGVQPAAPAAPAQAPGKRQMSAAGRAAIAAAAKARWAKYRAAKAQAASMQKAKTAK